MLGTLLSPTRLLTDFPALTPFWNSQTGYWPSSGTSVTSNLNYSYPEFNGLNLGNPDAVQVAIANYIRQHYGGFSPFGSTVPGVSLLAQPPATEGAPAPAAQDVAQVASAAVASSVKPAAADTTPHAESHGGHGSVVIYDWAARIQAKKYELGHGYVVLIFLGEVPDDPSQWRTCHSFTGAHCAFVNSDAEQCANCREQAELVVEGFVHLNTAIAKRSGLSSYEPSVVAPYLRDNLHWRVQAVRSFFAQFAPFESA
jgi:tyrosinase